MADAVRAETVQQLQARIRAMQATTLGSRTIPTSPVVAPLLPGGALKAGAAYSVPDSLALAMLLLAGPSAAGGWAAVIGVPEFGAEAAAGFGVALDRLVLVPHPGEAWLAVTAQIAEVVPVLLVRPPAAGATPTEAARLASRLRQRGSTLLVAGPWSGAEAALRVSGGRWTGIGAGSGYLTGRDLEVRVTAREVVTRHRLRITDGFRLDAVPAPAPAAPVRRLDPVPRAAPVRAGLLETAGAAG